jgi:hypothetical protein
MTIPPNSKMYNALKQKKYVSFVAVFIVKFLRVTSIVETTALSIQMKEKINGKKRISITIVKCVF